MRSESFNKKDKPVGTYEYAVMCEGGMFYVDMRSIISQKQKDFYKDMKFNITGDKLDIPANPKRGQELKNGTVQIIATSEGSPMTMKMSITISNRKVAAIEDITVPAGTFKCVK